MLVGVGPEMYIVLEFNCIFIAMHDIAKQSVRV